MWMDYSTILMYDKDMLEPCAFRRYIIILRGNGGLSIHDHEYTLNQHDAIIIPPDTKGRWISRDSRHNSVLLGCMELRDTVAVAASVNISIIHGENTDLIRRVFYLGLDTQDSEDPNFDSVNSAIHQLMFASLIAADLKTRIMNPQVYLVITDINHHFTEVDYDVRKVIEQTGYTANHFRKLFRKESGVTPIEFIMQRRLDRSVELFQQFKNRIPIKEIAWQSGYKDPYYFSRQFKKTFNISPQKYVERLLQQDNPAGIQE